MLIWSLKKIFNKKYFIDFLYYKTYLKEIEVGNLVLFEPGQIRRRRCYPTAVMEVFAVCVPLIFGRL